MSSRSHNFGNEERVYKALGHSMRIQLLFEVLEYGPTSPIQFVKKYKLEKNALGLASYHFKVLKESGLVILKEKIPRRGAQENIYEISADAPVADLISTFVNGSPEGHAKGRLDILHLDVDNRGLEEVKDATRDFRTGLEQAGEASQERLSSVEGALRRKLQIVYTDFGSKSS